MYNFRNVLVLAPHTDDGELGAGATIRKLVEKGAKITYVAFSSCEESVPSEFPRDILRTEVKLATKELGIDESNVVVLNYNVRYFYEKRQEILEDLISIRAKSNYDLVLTPSTQDIHQDHAVISQESIRAFKNTTILGYELAWNMMSNSNQLFVDVSESHLEAKFSALSKYQSQGFRGYLTREFVFSLAKSKGIQVGKEYSESFEVIRMYL
ncbi:MULTISPECIES: PIG-L deacetylase family protein [Vibrio]|uniref:PIG-L deacetylase family protein n=1 Tax=Vibrio TaxID=662 RepID=UPI000735B3A4|nr:MULTISPECIES: PIG-L deacetylase family protein [Vibrio]MCA3992584.1 PIG-L family deacetylase [Vibrio vulnificus]OQK57768.1 hypothetical protein XM76_c10266 [Vibrio vulnificus]OZT82820.1 LmbE family protein [Vibrio sp. 03_296]PJO12086.1 LmbE family protein [Vibrio vulnificus]PNM60284.1 LmbE family protein [Vibrio vulnificus]